MLNFKNKSIVTVLLPIFILLLTSNPNLFAQKSIPDQGIYDGKIGNDQIILVAEKTDTTLFKGYFVLNRGKAVEESHAFSLNTSGSQPLFQSDMYIGKMKSAKISPSAFD